ncbi:hypothetical protein HY857_00420 [Candidatus Saccharibacteria bacterium]|nr:hypothetical protein [Candidatus Saccharibacteria bacterium]
MDDVGGSDKDTGLVPNMLITDEFPRVIVLRYTIGGETIDIRVSRRGMWGWEPNRNLIGYMVSGDLHVHFVPDAHDLLHNRKG